MITVGVATGVLVAGATLQFGQVLYAQLLIILIFLAILKVRARRLAAVEGVAV